MSTRDLIDAIQSGDSLEIENAFNSIMSAKVSDKIDTMRSDIAQSMFASEETVVEEENLDDEEEELALEDYSLDELEEYMMSEEFEQLDELSKSTIGNYIKKAKGSVIGSAQLMGMGNKMTGQKTQDKAEKTVQKRASGINKAVDRLTKEGYDSSGAYEKHDPKHPDFVKNYNKYKAGNPQAKLADFVAHMKKQK